MRTLSTSPSVAKILGPSLLASRPALWQRVGGRPRLSSQRGVPLGRQGLPLVLVRGKAARGRVGDKAFPSEQSDVECEVASVAELSSARTEYNFQPRLASGAVRISPVRGFGTQETSTTGGY